LETFICKSIEDAQYRKLEKAFNLENGGSGAGGGERETFLKHAPSIAHCLW
jgi:hypothetical protein